MPEEKILEDGSTITVYSQEEIDAQKQAAIDEYKIQNPDKSGEVQKLQTELDEAKKSLAGLKDKDINVGILRKGFESKIEALEKNIDQKVGEVKETTKKEVLGEVMKDFHLDEINRLSSGDDELKKKIEYHYSRIQDAVGTKEEELKKLNDAYLLASRQETNNMSAFSSASASAPRTQQGGFSEDEKDLLKRMGKGHLVK